MVNAMEAMQRGGRLGLTLHGAADHVVIEISDTGTGIPQEILPLIFEPFFSTKTNESGSGLGLAVVYGIVHRHGGTIAVDSQVGVGTMFRISLPRVPPAHAEVHARHDALQPAGATI
jgi:two-component system cell cycle sensor histidine kinase/response regulator CckA